MPRHGHRQATFASSQKESPSRSRLLSGDRRAGRDGARRGRLFWAPRIRRARRPVETEVDGARPQERDRLNARQPSSRPRPAERDSARHFAGAAEGAALRQLLEPPATIDGTRWEKMRRLPHQMRSGWPIAAVGRRENEKVSQLAITFVGVRVMDATSGAGSPGARRGSPRCVRGRIGGMSSDPMPSRSRATKGCHRRAAKRVGGRGRGADSRTTLFEALAKAARSGPGAGVQPMPLPRLTCAKSRRANLVAQRAFRDRRIGDTADATAVESSARPGDGDERCTGS